MGQKVNPTVQRMGFIKDWQSRWFVPSKDYSKYILEDYNIRKFIKRRLKIAAVSKIIIERLSGRIKIKIFTARPGIIIGRHGQDMRLSGRVVRLPRPWRARLGSQATVYQSSGTSPGLKGSP